MASLAKVDHQIALLVLLHCIALLALSVIIEFVSSSARVTSVKFAKGVSVC